MFLYYICVPNNRLNKAFGSDTAIKMRPDAEIRFFGLAINHVINCLCDMKDYLNKYFCLALTLSDADLPKVSPIHHVKSES